MSLPNLRDAWLVVHIAHGIDAFESYGETPDSALCEFDDEGYLEARYVDMKLTRAPVTCLECLVRAGAAT